MKIFICFLIGFMMQLSGLYGQSKKLLEGWKYHCIDSTRTPLLPERNSGAWCFGIDVGDINGDGYTDIASGKWAYINPGKETESVWQRIVFPIIADALFVYDFDRDGKAEIYAFNCNQQYQLKLNASLNTFDTLLVAALPICNHGISTQGYSKGDITGDGVPELLINNQDNDLYAMQFNKAANNFITHCIAKGQTTDKGLAIGDLDGDGDNDVLTAYKPDNSSEFNGICWFENPGRITGKWIKHAVTQVKWKVDRVAIAHIDPDRQPEIIITEGRKPPGKDNDASVYILKSPGNPRDSAWVQKVLVNQYSTNSLTAIDFDQDGDMDLITAEHKGISPKLQLWLNDGLGNFTMHIVEEGKENHIGALPVDIDNDGDYDILGWGWYNWKYMHLWENKTIKSQ